MNKYKAIISKDILSKGMSLEQCIGVNEYAWSYQYVKKAIDELEYSNCVILGGDVYSIKNNSVEITYDNWYFSDKNTESAIKDSANQARKYIESYNQKNGNNYVFSLVYKDEKHE